MSFDMEDMNSKHKLDATMPKPDWARHLCGLYYDIDRNCIEIWTNVICNKCRHSASPIWDNFCDATLCLIGEEEGNTCDIDECDFPEKPKFWYKTVEGK